MADSKGMAGPVPEFCTNLRTKRYYLSDEPPATYLAQDSATTGYWCLRTMGNFGPDGDYACPETCGSGRPCYRSNVARPV